MRDCVERQSSKNCDAFNYKIEGDSTRALWANYPLPFPVIPTSPGFTFRFTLKNKMDDRYLPSTATSSLSHEEFVMRILIPKRDVVGSTLSDSLFFLLDHPSSPDGENGGATHGDKSESDIEIKTFEVSRSAWCGKHKRHHCTGNVWQISHLILNQENTQYSLPMVGLNEQTIARL